MTLALTLGFTSIFCWHWVEKICFPSLQRLSLTFSSHPNKLNETVFGVQNPSPPWYKKVVCVRARWAKLSRRLIQWLHLSPRVTQGRLAQGRGIHLGVWGWAQLEEAKELNVDSSGFNERSVWIWTSGESTGDLWGSFVWGDVGESNTFCYGRFHTYTFQRFQWCPNKLKIRF